MNKIAENKYTSTAGMRTTFWGPSAWNFLFTSVLGTYPEKIDLKNANHLRIKKEFKNLFMSLGYVMPCVFCRDSYKQFIKEMPIDSYLSGRIRLFFWLYKLKDKVNKKLIKQENDCFKVEHAKILLKYKEKKINKTQYKCLFEKLEKDILFTIPTPPFNDVLNYFEQFRAGCNNKSKTCR